MYDSYADSAGWSPDITIISASTLLRQFVWTWAREEVKYDVRLKEKNFLCFNKLQKGHRAYILARMLENGLFDRSFFSFEGQDQWLDDMNVFQWAPIINEQFTKHRSKFPIRCNITPARTNPVEYSGTDDYYHDESYFSVVTETLFYSADKSDLRNSMYHQIGGVFHTEKIARALMYKHPFILVAPAGSIKSLRELGFKTFHPFIDESYDSEEDDDLRIDIVVREIERLCSKDDAQWIVWQHSIKEIVEHNYKHIQSLPVHYNAHSLTQLFAN